MKLLFLALMSISTSAMADGFRDDCYHIYVGTYIPVCSNPKVEVPKESNYVEVPKESNYVDISRVIPRYEIHNVYNDSCHCVQQVLVQVN